MQKFFQSGYAFVLVALVFYVLGVVAERPVVFIVLGSVFFILALGVRKKKAQSATRKETKS